MTKWEYLLETVHQISFCGKAPSQGQALTNTPLLGQTLIQKHFQGYIDIADTLRVLRRGSPSPSSPTMV